MNTNKNNDKYNNPLNHGINEEDKRTSLNNESCMTCDYIFANKMECKGCEDFNKWCLARNTVFTD